MILALAGCAGSTEPTPGKPEPVADAVVLITVDTLRADHLGLYGYDRPTSPALDAFGASAVVFERAVSHAPWTKPSFGTMFTSTLPGEHGIFDWEDQLDDDAVTLAVALQSAGFATVAVASHDAFRVDLNNFELGFDVFDLSAIVGPGISPGDVSTADAVVDLALDQLATLEPPFLLWVHTFDVHDEYLPHEGHDFGERPLDLYDGEIAWTDVQLARLLDAVEARDRTLVVFTADHGEELQDHGGSLHTKTLYEEVVHVPLVLKWPESRPARVASTVGLIDVAPTVLAALGVELPGSFDGVPIPLVDGAAVLEADRAVPMEARRAADKRGMRLGDHKLVVDLETGTRALYDLRADPGETVDASERLPDVAAELDARMREVWPELP